MLETKGDVLFPAEMSLGASEVLGAAEVPIGRGEYQPFSSQDQGQGPLAQRTLLWSGTHCSEMAGEALIHMPSTFGGSLRHFKFRYYFILNLV